MSKVKFNNLEFPFCLYNASGCWCYSEEELTELHNSDAGAVICKSCTIKERKGNEKPRYYENQFGTINSMGLPNKGIKYYIDLIKKFEDKPYIFSIAGMSVDENLNIIKIISENVKKPTMIEINLSCPNIKGKPQIGYDFEEFESYLRILETLDTHLLIMGLKLPPYFDPLHFQIVSNIIKKYPKVKFITCINSLGNGLIIDVETESSVIRPKNGIGGIGGLYCKPIALSNVYQFHRLLGDSVKIIGCGGVTSGTDVFEHILAGATLVQVGSQLMKEGPSCFSRIKNELEEIMKKKGYNTLDNFRGKLNQTKKLKNNFTNIKYSY